MDVTGPRALRNDAELQARRTLLATAPNAQALREWSAALVERRQGAVVPDFDPADAGVNARVMLLLEAPGPMTNAGNARPGSGFISVDNDDQTAENCWRTRDEVGLQEHTLHWNIVPWYLGPTTKKPNATELAQGAMELRRLLPLLPDLRVVVLAGRHAQVGWDRHVRGLGFADMAVIPTWHPSPLSLNQPGHRDEFRRALSRAESLAR